MYTMVLYCPNRQELALVFSAAHFILRSHGVAESPLCLRERKELQMLCESDGTIVCAVCDVTETGTMPVLESLRENNPNMRLILLTDDSISPLMYVRPTILPTALLWRPVEGNTVRRVLGEVISTLPPPDSMEKTQSEVFSIELRGVVRVFEYDQILFFEAREKRLYLHLVRSEIPFTGTLEKLRTELPEGFIQIHKSFIVNKKHIFELQFGKNLLILTGGAELPISRSYKAALKAVFA